VLCEVIDMYDFYDVVLHLYFNTEILAVLEQVIYPQSCYLSKAQNTFFGFLIH